MSKRDKPLLWFSTRRIDRKWRLGRLSIGLLYRRADGCMGRFGGGWNWKLGIQASGRSVILSLLVFTVRFNVDTPHGRS